MSEYTFTDLLGLATQQASTSQPIPSQFASSSASTDQYTPSTSELYLSLGFTPEPGTGGA